MQAKLEIFVFNITQTHFFAQNNRKPRSAFFVKPQLLFLSFKMAWLSLNCQKTHFFYRRSSLVIYTRLLFFNINLCEVCYNKLNSKFPKIIFLRGSYCFSDSFGSLRQCFKFHRKLRSGSQRNFLAISIEIWGRSRKSRAMTARLWQCYSHGQA